MVFAEQALAAADAADIALDTSPISGGTTTLHALWMGLLLVTMEAQRGVDSSTAKMLKGLGFGGEVAKDEQAYIDAALLLMNSPERLRQGRLEQREWMHKSVLMDYATRTADLERAFRLMWVNYLRGNHKAQDLHADLEALLTELESMA